MVASIAVIEDSVSIEVLSVELAPMEGVEK
jgi:hypothetical protein